jgi:hypothetical protein
LGRFGLQFRARIHQLAAIQESKNCRTQGYGDTDGKEGFGHGGSYSFWGVAN